jgi:hypothetical protein
MYFPQNCEIGSALSKFRGLNPPNPLPLGTPLQNIDLFPKSKLVYSRSRNRNCNVLRTERQIAVRITDTSHHITSHHITSRQTTGQSGFDYRFPAGEHIFHLRPKQPAVQWILGTFPRGENSQNVSRTKYNHNNTARYEKMVLYRHLLYASSGAKETLFM